MFAAPSHADIDPSVALLADSPERRRAAVAQGRVLTADEHRGHPASLLGQLGPADGVDTPPDRVDATLRNSVADCVNGKAESKQVAAAQNSVLPTC